MGALGLAALTALEWCLAVYLMVNGYGCRLGDLLSTTFNTGLVSEVSCTT